VEKYQESNKKIDKEREQL